MKKLKHRTAIRSIGGLIMLLVVFSVIVSVIGYRSFTDALLSQYSTGAFNTAMVASQYVDADRVNLYVKSGGVTDEYKKVWNELDRLCNTSGSEFVYLIIPDRTDYEHIFFVFSTIDHNSTHQVYDFGYVRETTNEEYREKYRALYEKKSFYELVIRDEGYIETGSHITAMVPITDSAGEVVAIMCVQRQMDILVNLRQTYVKKILFVLIALAILVSVGQSLFLHFSVLKPLRMIAAEANRFSGENVTIDKKLRDFIRKDDEIGQLAESIDHMEEQIRNYVDHLTRFTAEKERISTELELAKRIQASMLPDQYPAFPDRSEFDIYASMDPAREVGGDFYDFFLIDEDHLCILIADVSGKGVPAALFMMASRIILANTAMTGKSPAQILTDTNKAICSNNSEEMFVTVWLGILEISTGRLTAANAGHEYPVKKEADGRFEILKDRHGFVIGGLDGVRYKEYELLLKPGAKLFLYTDGVPEATDRSNNLFGMDRLLGALNQDPDGSPEKILNTVRAEVDRFVEDAEQFDDLTMLCLDYRGSSEKKAEEDEK